MHTSEAIEITIGLVFQICIVKVTVLHQVKLKIKIKLFLHHLQKDGCNMLEMV